MSAISPEMHPKRSTLPTAIPLVARMTKPESKRLQWERGRSEEATFEEYKPWMHPGGGIPDRQGNMFNDYNTGNIFSESAASFDNTLLWQHEPQFMKLQPTRWRHLVKQKLRRCGRLVRL